MTETQQKPVTSTSASSDPNQSSQTQPNVVSVVFLRRNIEDPFTYRLESDRDVVGSPVVVPLGPSLTVGIAVDVEKRESVDGDVKPVRDVLDQYYRIPRSLIELGKWIADYYVAPLNRVFKSILPPKFLPSPTTGWIVRQTIDGGVEDVDEAVVRHVNQSEQLELPELSEAIDTTQESIKQQMGELENEGLVKETLTLENPDVSRRTLNYVDQTDERIDDRELTDKARECLDYLAENDGCFQKDLPESLGRSGLLSRLESKGLINRTTRVVRRDPFPDRSSSTDSDEIELTDEQSTVLSQVREEWKRGEFATHLLHGVTGSGKTEVYFRLVEQALERGETALVLVPEITLAAFMVNRFRDRFGDRLAVLHSGLSEGERLDEWIRILEGDAKVVLGVQSAVFAPLEDLGLIVVDEEHDTSYKAGRSPRYHARDVAIKRGQMADIPVVLGSATPSLESYSNALKGRYKYLEMTERPLGGELPDVRILDLRNEESPVNEELLEKTRSVLESNRKAIWFLNRRGFSNFLLCSDCGEVVTCQNCDVSLTYHSKPKQLRCHYCGYSRGVPDRCPNCRGHEVEQVGMGTQHLEDVASDEFGDAGVIRMDSDTVSKKRARFDRLREFDETDPCLLIGTQMVTKGLDFEGVDLVGVLNVDTGLHLPDFRAGEHTFQQLVQVCGRAGREQAGAEVLVQTYNPGHYAIQLGSRQTYDDFFEKECSFRKPLGYPPYSRIINIIATDVDEDKVARELNELYEVLGGADDVDLLGPAPCGIDYVKGKHRWHLMARGTFSTDWRRTLRTWVLENQHDVRLSLDVDPTDVL